MSFANVDASPGHLAVHDESLAEFSMRLDASAITPLRHERD